MKKILKSGSVYMGTCGDLTDLYDSDGNNLRVGDLVAAWTQEVEERGWNDSPAFVVQEKNGQHYIMGFKSADRVREYVYDGESSDAKHYDSIFDSYRYALDPSDSSKKIVWNVIRIKPYDKTGPGEAWDNISVIDADSETELEDGITTCCGYDFGMDQFDETIRFCPKCGRRIRKPQIS